MRSINILWLNACKCGGRKHTVQTEKGDKYRLFEDDSVTCNACTRKGVVQTSEGFAHVWWETDEEQNT